MFFGVNCSEDTKKVWKTKPRSRKKMRERKNQTLPNRQGKNWNFFYILKNKKKKWKKQRRSDAWEQNLENPIHI